MMAAGGNGKAGESGSTRGNTDSHPVVILWPDIVPRTFHFSALCLSFRGILKWLFVPVAMIVLWPCSRGGFSSGWW